MKNNENVQNIETREVHVNELSWQQDLMHRIINALTMSDEMKKELEVDPRTLQLVR